MQIQYIRDVSRPASKAGRLNEVREVSAALGRLMISSRHCVMCVDGVSIPVEAPKPKSIKTKPPAAEKKKPVAVKNAEKKVAKTKKKMKKKK